MTSTIAARKIKLHDQPVFGMVLHGSEFLFLKLVQGEIPSYALSDVFSLLNRGNDLYEVLQVLKQLGNLLVKAEA